MSELPIQIDFNPSIDDLEQILKFTTFPSNNWTEIRKCFDNNAFVIAKTEGKPIGFIAYKFDTVCIYISIAETHPDFYNQGIAKRLVAEICDHYSDSQFKALYLYCAPVGTKYAWEKIGFTNYPKGARNNKSEVYMYRIFGDVCKVKRVGITEENLQNAIMIYDTETPRDGDSAKWYAEVEFFEGTNKLKKPLLFFGNDKWQIKIKRDGFEIVKGRYSDYDKKSSIYECLYIDVLKVSLT
ncbi:GNAT family N-acetyltransferase [Sphingobacterium siyangense]|uniref:GNAT family N-acetyltransferase n=1 Tax=Sphingobacterium siyangense TaxID=459529 RepID=UPI00196326B7|nr:GNAT family N-acetyltransferase [Sphingobacterium siyangense]QRY55933.1 GNAT family N-acetyltransferase [Sphingobacterium siyangense]